MAEAVVLVASPIAIGNTPVANGSRVPACPTWVPVLRRTGSTTRFEVMPSGLVETSQPCRPPSAFIVVVLRPSSFRLEVPRHLGPREQLRNPVGLIKQIVEREKEVR